jgi:hypothetical protein
MSEADTLALFQDFRIIGSARISYGIASAASDRFYPSFIIKNLTVDLLWVTLCQKRVIRRVDSETKQ